MCCLFAGLSRATATALSGLPVRAVRRRPQARRLAAVWVGARLHRLDGWFRIRKRQLITVVTTLTLISGYFGGYLLLVRVHSP